MEAKEMSLSDDTDMVRAILRNYKASWISSKKTSNQSNEKSSESETKDSPTTAKESKTGK